LSGHFSQFSPALQSVEVGEGLPLILLFLSEPPELPPISLSSSLGFPVQSVPLGTSSLGIPLHRWLRTFLRAPPLLLLLPSKVSGVWGGRPRGPAPASSLRTASPASSHASFPMLSTTPSVFTVAPTPCRVMVAANLYPAVTADTSSGGIRSVTPSDVAFSSAEEMAYSVMPSMITLSVDTPAVAETVATNAEAKLARYGSV